MAFGDGLVTMREVSVVDVLLVEDNRELAELIGTFLRRDGYAVEIQESGERALAFL